MGCCPMSYWCTADGPQPGVEGTDGVTVYPPEGALSGPYASYEKALEVGCESPLLTSCTDCTFSYRKFWRVSIENVISGAVLSGFTAGMYGMRAGPDTTPGAPNPCRLLANSDQMPGGAARCYTPSGGNCEAGCQMYWSLNLDAPAPWIAGMYGAEQWRVTGGCFNSGFGFGVGWVSAGPGFVLGTPSLIDWTPVISRDPPQECGSAVFINERIYLGRVGFYDYLGNYLPVYGTCDVYVQT